MMPITRRDLEILLDSPDHTDYVVSAYVDLRVQDGFHRLVDQRLRNAADEAGEALATAEARKALDENIEIVREAIRERADPAAKGMAVFAAKGRGLKHAVPLDFPVDAQLVIDEEPFVLPLLERWHAQPTYLVAVVDSHHAQLFEAHSGVPEPVRRIDRDVAEDIQRDKPRFTYKKRFSQTRHERLHGLEDDGFFKEVAAAVAEQWKGNGFSGLIVLGKPQVTSALRAALPKELAAAVVLEAVQAMTSNPDDVADDIDRALREWRDNEEQRLLHELEERWKEGHLVGDGPTEVLDALQQGRAARVVIGTARSLPGARCGSCGYRFGAPVATCVYCNGACRTVNAVQEIFRMALRHRVPVHLFRPDLDRDPLARAGGVCALLVAEANWAPDLATARASQGHA